MKTEKLLPFTESRRIADLVQQAIADLPTRKVRRILREVSEPSNTDFAAPLWRLARLELQRRDRRRSQPPLL